MRNLKLKYIQQYTQGIAHPKFLLLNPNSCKFDDARFVVTDDKLFLYKPGSAEPPKILAEVPDIVAAEYLALENEICLATSVGEVLLVNPETQQLSEGTFCDVGIASMAWSPDQEVVVFVTKQHNVVVMTCTYDALTEHALDDETSEAEGEFVNVGWGKKETQFHGSEGKQAAKNKLEEGSKVNADELPKVKFICFFAIEDLELLLLSRDFLHFYWRGQNPPKPSFALPRIFLFFTVFVSSFKY